MHKPTREEIKAEIAALERCKTYVPRMSKWDDNHALIDIQIRFLKGQMDTVSDEWEELGESLKSAVMDAEGWMEAQMEAAPSAAWVDYDPAI